MKKWLLFFCIFAIIVFFSFCSYVYCYRAEFASHSLSQLFGTPAKIGNIRFAKNGFIIDNVTIYNAPESGLQTAFAAKSIYVKMCMEDQLTVLLGTGVAQIDKISIYKPLFGIEFFDASGSQSNWKTFLENGVNNCKEGKNARAFHVKNVTLEKVAIEFLNKAASSSIQHPHSIDKIQLGQVKDAPPTSIYRMIHATAKISLYQIGSTMKELEFAKSINAIPLLPAPSSLELIKLKNKEEK